MNYKPTAAALKIARHNGNADCLNLYAGIYSNAASNPRGSHTLKLISKRARIECAIGPGIRLFELAP